MTSSISLIAQALMAWGLVDPIAAASADAPRVKRIRRSKYMPHQGYRERARRINQINHGRLKAANGWVGDDEILF